MNDAELAVFQNFFERNAGASLETECSTVIPSWQQGRVHHIYHCVLFGFGATIEKYSQRASTEM
eukprot:2516-Heterococcus_DN1.PRE.1